jgi:hypothetical protein
MDFSKELKGSDKELEKLFKLDKIKTSMHLSYYFPMLNEHLFLGITRSLYFINDASEPKNVANFQLFTDLLKVLCDNKKLIKENDTGIAYFIDNKNVYFFEYMFINGIFELKLSHYKYYMPEKSKARLLENINCLDNLLEKARQLSIENGDTLTREEMQYNANHCHMLPEFCARM